MSVTIANHENKSADLSSNIYSFVKEENTWFIEFKAYLKRQASSIGLEIIRSGDEILNLLAGEGDKLTLKIDTKPYRDSFILQQVHSTVNGGGYYMLKTHTGRVLKKKLWLSDVLLLIFGDLPYRVYVSCIR